MESVEGKITAMVSCCTASVHLCSGADAEHNVLVEVCFGGDNEGEPVDQMKSLLKIPPSDCSEQLLSVHLTIK